MPATDEEPIVRELLWQLEQRGVPEGVWLVEIELVRDALRQADRTLTSLHDALIRAAETGGNLNAGRCVVAVGNCWPRRAHLG
jgi:hypothetical protein